MPNRNANALIVRLVAGFGVVGLLLAGMACQDNGYDPKQTYATDASSYLQPRPQAEIMTRDQEGTKPSPLTSGEIPGVPALPMPGKSDADAKETPAADTSPLSQDVFSQKVSLSFRDAEIRDILRIIGETYKLNIVGVNLIDKKVTISLHEVPLRDAFDTILRYNGFRYEIIGEIVVVRGKSSGVTGKVFSLNHVKPKDIEPILQAYMASSKIEGSISVLENPSRLVIMAPAEEMGALEAMLKQLDARPKQVIIKASIIAIDSSSLSNLGITVGGPGETPASGLTATSRDVYTKEFANYTKFLTGNILFPGPSSTLTGGQLTFGSATDRWAFDAKVDALVSDGKAKILSQPRIGVISQQTAKIVVGQEVLFNLETTVSGSGNVVESSQFREAGIALEVTPVVGDDDYVTIKVKPEVSSFIGDITTQESPPISTTKAETMVYIKNRHTAVIAGLVSRTDSTKDQGLPGLRRVPILNFFMSSRSRTWQQQEIIVLITPEIIRSGDQWPIKGAEWGDPRRVPWQQRSRRRKSQ